MVEEGAFTCLLLQVCCPELAMADPDEARVHSEDQMEDGASEEQRREGTVSKRKKKQKICKPGIVYMSSVPYRMTVKRVRETLSQYGELGRVFLQPETRVTASGKKEKNFCEGWIEFKDKSLAKRVAASLNNTMVGGRRRSKAHDCLWNLKYLPRFKWVHLNEQLAYEGALHHHRMRAETAQAKREASCFAEQVEKGGELKRLEETVLKKGGLWERYQRQIKQRKTIPDKEDSAAKNPNDFFGMIFSST